MKTTWRTLWQHNDIVVYRDEVEVDRLPADAIERVYLVYRGQRQHAERHRRRRSSSSSATRASRCSSPRPASPGASTSSASRTGRSVVASTGSPRRSRCCRGGCAPARGAVKPTTGLPAPAPRRARRLRRALQLEGPQTWEDRKRRRIERSRPFGFTSSGAHA
jgi:hypothetical protein